MFYLPASFKSFHILITWLQHAENEGVLCCNPRHRVLDTVTNLQLYRSAATEKIQKELLLLILGLNHNPHACTWHMVSIYIHTVFSTSFSRAQWRVLAMLVRISDPATAWQKSSLQTVHVTSSDSIAPLVWMPLKQQSHAIWERA